MNKDYSISLIRFISLLMIICCHILQGLNIELAFWVNVGVQIFFFMSGFLYGKKDDCKGGLKWYKKQFKKIICPLIILEIIMILIDYFIFHIAYSKYQIIANFIGFGAFYGPFPVISHTWFISYILICYLITPMLNKIEFNKMDSKNAFKYLFMIIIFLELLEYFKVTNVNAAWISNYILGYFFSNYYIKEGKDYKKFLYVFISLTIIILIPRLVIQYGNFNLPKFILDNKEYLYSWSHVLLGSSLFIIMYTFFSKLKIKENIILDFSDKYSYYIYLTHQIFILNYTSLLFITESLVLNIFIILVISIISGVVLYLITNVLRKMLNI